MRRHLLTSLAVAALIAMIACKPPRSPRESADAKISGDWSGESPAVGAPHDTGKVEWTFKLREVESGKFEGIGSRSQHGRADQFDLRGVRGENEIRFEFETPHGEAEFKGAVMDVKTIVGQIYAGKDTLPLGLRRK